MDPRSVVTTDPAAGTPRRVDKPSGKSVVMAAKRWHVLEILAKAEGWRALVELGVREGWTSCHLLAEIPVIRVTGVDLYTGNDALAETVRNRYARFGGRAKLLRMDTALAAGEYHGLPDCVFVDADHSVAACMADIAAWRPKIRRGGWLMGHDWHFPAVRQAVADSGIRPALFPDNVWGVRC